jgi:hypothetical protein
MSATETMQVGLLVWLGQWRVNQSSEQTCWSNYVGSWAVFLNTEAGEHCCTM